MHTLAPADDKPALACLNCDATTVGPFCHRCGQVAGPTHRSLLHLLAESVEALTHGDSRVVRTARLLALDPGRLTRDYLDGRRVADLPPLRVFFIGLFLLLVVLSAVVRGHVGLGHAPPDWHDALVVDGHPALSAWLVRHVGHAVDDPAAIVAEMEVWAERMLLLALPLTAVSMKILFAGRRPSIPIYDHTIFGLHSLGFAMLLLAVVVAGDTLGLDVVDWGLLLLPLHAYRHMRGAFGGGAVATAARTILLLGVEATGLLVLTVILALIGLEWG